jgi:EAL domain-containing protein (putative c-di-GMP-specific phosphodiesterase class I)
MHRLAVAKREALAHMGETHALTADRAGLEASFDRALVGLWIAYQPIISWRQRRVWGYEALVRSDEPSLPHPGLLFDAAERLDRLFDLGRAIRGQVARAAPDIPDNIEIFVNLHPNDLLDTELYSAKSPLSAIAARVVLELTERVSLDRIPELADRLWELRCLGFRLAVDDLGSGYAGLSAFAKIEPEVAKIDMSLVRDVDRDPTKLRLIQAMIDVCNELRILVVNEGIETLAERDTLAGIGCDLMQGYLFAKPGRQPPMVQL